MEPDPYIDITQQRLKALDDFVKGTGSSQAILWLFNMSRGNDELLLSYAVGYSPDQLLCMRNRSISLPKNWRTHGYSDTSLNEEIELSLRLELEAAEVKEADLQLHPLISSRNIDPNVNRLTGAIFFNAPPQPSEPRLIELRSRLLAESIESLRLDRLRTAAIGLQSAFQNKRASTNETLKAIGRLLKRELGADEYAFINENTDVHPTKKDETSSSPEALTSDRSTFTISQDSFILESCKFTPGHKLSEGLEAISTNELRFTFSGKKRNGYLQNCFSDTDLMVASHVFGYIEPYAAARIFDENYEIIHSKLSRIDMREAGLPQDVQSLCKELSVAFRNTFLIIADYTDDDVRLDVRAANLSSTVSERYLERLKERYLAKWIPDPMSDLIMRAGIDVGDDHCFLEFHLPGDGRRSHVYLLQYAKPTITVSILRSIVIFFNELHNRLKKKEQQSDTLSYLTQVRHAVIHHFSAAAGSMASLRPIWERGRKSKAYWETLFQNPILGDQISKSIWSLGEAQLLIDNGRFLLGELDRLNRKNYQIASTVESCLRTLNSQRRARGIVVKGVTKGVPASVMNADEPILRVAIMNIVDNAFKYSQVNSTVVWEIDYGSEGYRLSITSAGAPIGERQFQQYLKIGVRGYQRDHLNQRHGTGLGLPVANKILIAHAPQARLQLSPEKRHHSLEGSTNTFFFDMPYLTGQSHRGDLEVSE